DQFERRVDAMAARHASVAEGFAPFRAATARSRTLPEPQAAGERPTPSRNTTPPVSGDVSGVAARLPSVTPGFSVPAGAVHGQRPLTEAAPDARAPATSGAQAMGGESVYVPFEVEPHVEAVAAAEPVTAEDVHAPATRMPKTAHSVAQRMAAAKVLPALADLTEEERLALFT
ncbi:MAG TPA: hypothetical protein VFL51_13970, partial [Pseudolabrys sp.]|nr:hypothetical protein [Pseudolabrys sp.]